MFAARRVTWLLAVSLNSAVGVLAAEEPSPFDAPAAVEYLRQRGGHAMLIYHHDKLVFEEYFNGYDGETPHRLASGTKSFWGAAAVAAADDELLTLDEPVAETIDEWRDDPLKSQITIRQLLSLTSGLDAGDNGRVPVYADAIQADAIWLAGGEFRYGPVPFQIFGEVLRRKLAPRGEGPLDYLRRRILDPIGLKVGRWRHGADGNPHMPSGAFLTAREWARFGLLIKNKGRFGEKQLLSEERLAECLTGTRANPSYGLTFWLNTSEDGPKDLVMAAGAGKQKLYIVPSLDLLVVQFAEARGFREREFLERLLGKAEKRGRTAETPSKKGGA